MTSLYIGVSRGGALGAEAPPTRGPKKKKKRRKKKEKERRKEKEKEKERKGEREGKKERKKERKKANDNEKYLSPVLPLNRFQISRHGPIRRTPQQF